MHYKRLAAVVTASTAAAAALVASTTPAHAAPVPLYTTWVSVQTPSGSSGTKVLDIKNRSTADRGQAHLWANYTTGEVRSQRWTISYDHTRSNGNKVYKLKNALSGKCLDKSEDVPNANGNAVYQYTCNDNANNQLWERIGSSGWTQLRNVASGRCLDVKGPSFTDGAILHVWDCYSTWSQRWNIDK
ncbi:hypothetical protein GCM10027074_67980 [Streptomyces deserti]